MATQSLYRRYRPRRFGEIRGQDHVVRALRNAVLHEREGQGYLFSGPRGTGKTTSARVLAKVLNCTDPVEGEPCCVCASCRAVEAGTSFDVHELDAASNNGVEAMRDLIEKASLGTPGRHKVYILDEVHMLSKGAEAALLKTLEEPPPHVVFVLATTDPHKVSPTIRSRVQHLEFHLLGVDELDAHIRWVAADAGLTISDDAFRAVLTQGGGSARDTLSALELVAASGGDAPDTTSYEEFIEALIANDPGHALSALAHAVQQGRDPRTLAQELIRHLRDCFLSLMAPELVQLPQAEAASVSEQAHRLGAAAAVRAMERLGTMLVEMRHAPDPRLLLDIALVQLTSESHANDPAALLARLERLEKVVASGAAAGTGVAVVAAPADPATGRAALGGRVRRDEPPQPLAVGAAAADLVAAAAAASATALVADGSVAAASPTDAPAAVGPLVATPPPVVAATRSAPAMSSTAAEVVDVADRLARAWQSDVLPTMKPMARALFSAGRFLGERDGALTFGLPNETHRSRCEQHRAELQAAITVYLGLSVSVALVVDASSGHDDHLAPVVSLRGAGSRPGGLGSTSARHGPGHRDDQGPGRDGSGGDPGGDMDDDIDVDDLVDAPPGSVKTVEDRLSDAFPGSVFVDDRV